MVNRVQRYNKILEYANFGGGKMDFLEKSRIKSDFNGRNSRHIMPHNRHREKEIPHSMEEGGFSIGD